MNTIDITHIIEALIGIVAAVVSAFLIPWIKSRTTDAQRKDLIAWTKIGVAAAEQIFSGNGRGQEKKQYVLDFLASKGLKVDKDSIDNAIEAAVKQLNTDGLSIE